MDWITEFLSYTDGVPSPEIFRLWSAITAVSGALERRVYANTGRGRIYPNLFTLLVGPPAAGKSQAISPVAALWMQAIQLLPPTEQFHIAPDNVTKAALVDALSRARGQRLFKANDITPGGLMEWHSMFIASPEFGVLIPRHDLEFLSVLNHIYDNPPYYREERRTLEGKNPDIFNPQLTILAGTQPDYLNSILPPEAWGMGFTSRIIMVYASTPPKIDLFAEETPGREKTAQGLARRLAGLSSLTGHFSWTAESKGALAEWYSSGMAPAPEHVSLTHYLGRRILHMVKLCMISAASRGESMEITGEDFSRAKGWLLEVEALMPDVFRAMLSRNDANIIQELHYHLWRLWATVTPDKRSPVPEAAVYEYLNKRVPSEKIAKILEVAERSGVIVRSAGGGFIPRPKSEHSGEV